MSLTLSLLLPVLVPVQESTYAEQVSAALARFHVDAAYDELVAALARYRKPVSGQAMLDAVWDRFAKPVSGLDFSERTTDRLLLAGKDKDLGRLLEVSAGLLDHEPELRARQEPVGMAALIELVAAASERAGEAFSDIDDPDALAESMRMLLGDFAKHIYVHQKPQNRATWKRARAVDWAKLYEAAAMLAPFVADGFDKRFRRVARELGTVDVTVPGVEGNLLFAEKSPHGWILVGGPGKNRYDCPVALVIDVGGNDVYTAKATRSGPEQRINVVVDLEGRDSYEAGEDFAQACGLLGVSLLVDCHGHDTYAGKRAAQGVGALGIGILVDGDGRDHYTADAFAQGAGCFGLGLLLDGKGNDEMTAALASQGFGWPLSTGICIDLAGDDVRSVTGKYPSAYGTKGQWNGMGMGCSVGFRTLANGGFGILLDGGGDDVSRAGEFSVGLGYFFGCGIYRDVGGDDRVFASRYGIASGAHFGLGYFIDDEGDDVYENVSVAALAGNWDLTVSMFLDKRGNDHYKAQGLSLGSATITSFAAFLDLDGTDVYTQTGTQSFGHGGHAQDVDRKTTSVAVFLDHGGDDDVYPKTWKATPAPANDVAHAITVERKGKAKVERTAGKGVFVDK